MEKIEIAKALGKQVYEGKHLSCPICSPDAMNQDQPMFSYGDYENILFCPHCDLTVELKMQPAGLVSEYIFLLKKVAKLKVVLDKLVRIKQMADGQVPLVSNQGQGLDGYSELANYRGIIKKYLEQKDR